jgi:hypothetical protein
MPPVSQSQRRFFRWADEHPEESGVSRKVSEEFNSSDPGGKLPEHVSKRALGGGIGMARGGGLGMHGGMHLAGNIIPQGHLVPGFAGSTFKPPKPEGTNPTTWSERSEARGIDKPMSGSGGAFATGGGIGNYQDGGDVSPWFERQEARNEIDMPQGGFLNSSVAGRTDRLPLAVAADSHVMPADVISGLGQDNSLSGANVMKAVLRAGPYGTPHPQVTHGHGPPRAPGVPGEVEREMFGYAEGGGIGCYAEGGGIGNSPHLQGKPQINLTPRDGTWEDLGDKTPMERGGHGNGREVDHGVSHTLMAGGEFVVPPHDWTDGQSWYRGVRSIGEGDIDKGHERLRNMTKIVREHHIKFLQSAPEPKR